MYDGVRLGPGRLGLPVQIPHGPQAGSLSGFTDPPVVALIEQVLHVMIDVMWLIHVIWIPACAMIYNLQIFQCSFTFYLLPFGLLYAKRPLMAFFWYDIDFLGFFSFSFFFFFWFFLFFFFLKILFNAKRRAMLAALLLVWQRLRTLGIFFCWNTYKYNGIQSPDTSMSLRKNHPIYH